jgi:translation initiation factor 2 subunit 1
VKINLIAPPHYVMTTVSLDKEKGIEVLQLATDKIRGVITEKKGMMNVKMAPKAVTESDEKELAAKMEEYERENADEDEDDEEGGEAKE